MKTSEFLNRLNELNFYSNIESNSIVIIDQYGNECMEVSSEEQYNLSIFGYSFGQLNISVRKQLLDLVYGYTPTPAKERGMKNRKYFLEYKTFTGSPDGNCPAYLQYNPETDNVFIADLNKEDENWISKFTLDEIQEIKNNYSTDLGEFKLVDAE